MSIKNAYGFLTSALLAILVVFILSRPGCFGIQEVIVDEIKVEDPALVDSVKDLTKRIEFLKADREKIAEAKDSLISVIDTMSIERVTDYVYETIQKDTGDTSRPLITDGVVCYTEDQNKSIAKKLKENEILKAEVKVLDTLVFALEKRDSFQIKRIEGLRSDNIKLANDNRKLKRRRWIWFALGVVADRAVTAFSK